MLGFIQAKEVDLTMRAIVYNALPCVPCPGACSWGSSSHTDLQGQMRK